MNQTPTHRFLNAVSMAFLMFGIATIISAHSEMYMGSLTAQLPTFDEVQTPYEAGAGAEVLRPAAPDAEATAMIEKQLALGMLIVLAGCGIHLLVRSRTEEQREKIARLTPSRRAYVMK